MSSEIRDVIGTSFEGMARQVPVHLASFGQGFSALQVEELRNNPQRTEILPSFARVPFRTRSSPPL